MGGAIITITGKTKKEVARKLETKVEEALVIGLCEEARSEIESIPLSEKAKDNYRAFLKVHS